jgi:CelD/BcsL family acetyltransferase involved in cellulose biosynthesis
LADNHYRVAVSTDPASVKDRWQSLIRKGECTAFQGYEWCELWYRTLGRVHGAAPLIVIVTDVRAGRDVMLMPLCHRREGGLRIVEFADLGVSDYTAPVLARGFAPDRWAMQDIWALVRASLPPADVLRLARLPEKIGEDASNPLLFLPGCRRIDMRAHGLRLPESWQAYETGFLKRHFRADLRRRRRKLEALGQTEFIVASSVDDIRQVFKAMLAQRRHRFAALGHDNCLEHKEFRQFYERFILDHGGEGLVALTALKVDGEIIATNYGLIWNDRYLDLVPTFNDDKWGKFSAGRLIIVETMRWRIEADARSYYDFTIGDESYKRHFGTVAHDLHALEEPLSWRGRLPCWRTRMKYWLKKQPGVLRARDGLRAVLEKFRNR